MPGMMDTILNLGLNDKVVVGLAKKTGNERFAWDSYRRFIQMYGDVVLGMKPTNKEDIDPFEAIIEDVKKAKGVRLDNELGVAELQELVVRFKAAVKAQTGQDFPENAYEQLWGAICAVFDSWINVQKNNFIHDVLFSDAVRRKLHQRFLLLQLLLSFL